MKKQAPGKYYDLMPFTFCDLAVHPLIWWTGVTQRDADFCV